MRRTAIPRRATLFALLLPFCLAAPPDVDAAPAVLRPDGPLFWANLPQGDYRIIATFRNHREMKSLKVAGGAGNAQPTARARSDVAGLVPAAFLARTRTK